MSPWLTSGTTTTSSLTGSSSTGSGVRERVAQTHRGRGLERHLGAVDGVVLAVEAGDLHVDDGEAERAAVLLGLDDALFDRGDEVARDHAADDRVDELVAAAAFLRLDPQPRHRELTVPAALLLQPALGLGGAADRLPVRDVHFVGLDLDTELAGELLGRDRQVGLAHAAQHRLMRLRVALDAQHRVFLLEPVQRVGELVLVALALGVDRDREQRLGRGQHVDFDATRPWPRARRRSRCGLSLATAAMSPAATSLTASCSLPRIENSWCMRSSVFDREFVSTSSCLTVPCSTLNRFT